MRPSGHDACLVENSSTGGGSMLFVLFRGRQGILRLCLLASTIATPEDANTDADLFVRFVETNWMVLALLLHLFPRGSSFRRRAPWFLVHPSQTQVAPYLLGSLASFFGAPCPAKPGATVLCGARNNPMICNGSKRAAPEHRFAQTYDYCVDKPCIRLFFTLSAAIAFVAMDADCTNAYAYAYANAPSSTQPAYVRFGRCHYIPRLQASAQVSSTHY
jgi:hypothetical protein